MLSINQLKILISIIFLWLLAEPVHAQCPAPKAYTNPVISGFFPDPSVVRAGDDYYCVNSTFEYFPAIVISHSKDLVNWQQVGHVFSKSEDLDLSYFFDGMGIWAPDISYFNGDFYIFYCLVQLSKDRSTNVRGNYMVKSKSIYGPWSKPVQITDFGSDPSHFVDDDGEHYMLFAAGIPTGNGTKIVKLNRECTKMVEEPHWMETEGKKAAPEGPHMLEPKVEARLLQELQVQRHEKGLEIGTGSGFMAALLAHRAMQVFTLECRPALAHMARESLRRNGVVNVKVLEVSAAEGARGLPGEAPFDVILLSGSVAEVPRTLLQQLKVGGRLAAIVGELPIMRARLFTRVGDDAWSDVDLFDTVAARLEGFGEPGRFKF